MDQGVQVFCSRIINSNFIFASGRIVNFVPSSRNPGVGTYETSDPVEIAELLAACRTSHEYVYQDIEMTKKIPLAKGVDVSKQEQEVLQAQLQMERDKKADQEALKNVARGETKVAADRAGQASAAVLAAQRAAQGVTGMVNSSTVAGNTAASNSK